MTKRERFLNYCTITVITSLLIGLVAFRNACETGYSAPLFFALFLPFKVIIDLGFTMEHNRLTECQKRHEKG
jgi:hypothetical protein